MSNSVGPTGPVQESANRQPFLFHIHSCVDSYIVYNRNVLYLYGLGMVVHAQSPKVSKQNPCHITMSVRLSVCYLSYFPACPFVPMLVTSGFWFRE